jgi:hypothetical protein
LGRGVLRRRLGGLGSEDDDMELIMKAWEAIFIDICTAIEYGACL